MKDIRGRSLQADGIQLNQGLVLQCIKVQNGPQGLSVQHSKDAGHGHITGSIQLLDAGHQAGRLHLDGHITIFQHTLDSDFIAFLLDFCCISNLRQVQLFSNLGANLSGIAIDCLTAAENHVILFQADMVDCSSQ